MEKMTNLAVAKKFESYPEPYKTQLLTIRQLILDTAKQSDAIGEIEESLKWNQPSYATIKSKAGSPIRIDRFGEEMIALFFHCQTTLIENFRILFKDQLLFSKNRAILLDPKKELPTKELTFCINSALTYHLTKQKQL